VPVPAEPDSFQDSCREASKRTDPGLLPFREAREHHRMPRGNLKALPEAGNSLPRPLTPESSEQGRFPGRNCSQFQVCSIVPSVAARRPVHKVDHFSNDEVSIIPPESLAPHALPSERDESITLVGYGERGWEKIYGI